MPDPLLLLAGAVVLGALGLFLHKRRMLISFLLNGVLGLLCCIVAVCLSPALGITVSFNMFTASVCALLGPGGAAGIVFICLIWDL